ncbi:hypothetical protein FLM06_15195 [Vibrio cholerae]|uniref:Uncharacterized protein n=2 Tax=Vibrio cholerae TaxID=666 RepID=A0A5B1C4P4_VIBCL|nr:hypothetical protein [Vibrio cholerae]EGQ7970473.1 hypothetical protein [Vibrio cholerae]EGQ8316006.1 hypothetical protein [Vibrio cholerae]EGR0593932.1 hypothetical protein [Vibrio cholerae]EGR4217891.1 hypothetical protein [Vibrio cholerae]EGR5011823.1 hypothetical protein [Vibrio cholerae]
MEQTEKKLTRFELALEKRVSVGFLGTTLGVFAARALTSAAIVTVGKTVAKKAYDAAFNKKVYSSDATPQDCITRSNVNALASAKLLVNQVVDKQAYVNANNAMEASCDNISHGLNLLESGLDNDAKGYFREAIKAAAEAKRIANDKVNPGYLGLYYNAASLFILASRQHLSVLTEEKEIAGYKKLLIENIDEFISHVSNENATKKFMDSIEAKFGEVKPYSSKNWHEFSYSYDDAGSKTTILAPSEGNMAPLVRECFLEAELQAAYNEMVQPDVINQWLMLKAELQASD